MGNLTPQEIVQELDKHIIGQENAKRSVAIAMRNRIRRMQLPVELRNEVTPKNILMIGPTGVGKTEIARRLAKLAGAPFIKVEATKYTEVGYVGREVESMIRDLTDISVKLAKSKEYEKVNSRAEDIAEERILDALLPKAKHGENEPEDLAATRQVFRKKLRQGELDDKDIEIEVSQAAVGIEIMAPPGMEDMTSQLQNMFQNISGDKMKVRKMKVKDAKRALKEEESAKLVNDEDIKSQAIEQVEQTGIIFIDEIDKVTQRSERAGGGDVSREGVQRDLLPLIEGSTVSTKYGPVKTDHILFIASGAFHLSKPSDLIPELQGRLPIRVELDALKPDDFIRILTEPDASLTRQYSALLETEGVTLNFNESGIKELANIAWKINEKTENIGARRLHTVIERLLEDVSFNAVDLKGKTVEIDSNYVNERLADVVQDEDLSRFIL